VQAGFGHSLALTEDGSVYGWGSQSLVSEALTSSLLPTSLGDPRGALLGRNLMPVGRVLRGGASAGAGATEGGSEDAETGARPPPPTAFVSRPPHGYEYLFGGKSGGPAAAKTAALDALKDTETASNMTREEAENFETHRAVWESLLRASAAETNGGSSTAGQPAAGLGQTPSAILSPEGSQNAVQQLYSTPRLICPTPTAPLLRATDVAAGGWHSLLTGVRGAAFLRLMAFGGLVKFSDTCPIKITTFFRLLSRLAFGPPARAAAISACGFGSPCPEGKSYAERLSRSPKD